MKPELLLWWTISYLLAWVAVHNLQDLSIGLNKEMNETSSFPLYFAIALFYYPFMAMKLGMTIALPFFSWFTLWRVIELKSNDADTDPVKSNPHQSYNTFTETLK